MTASSIPADQASPDVEAPTEAELAAGLSRLRRRGTVVATDRWLAVAGGVLMPLGAVLVLLGWYGAAHTTRLFEEVPYLISGGIFGLVLVVIGAALYFGYWLTRLVGTERQVLESLGRIEERLGGTPADEAGAPSTNGTSFVATKTGSMFHRPECPVVAGRPDRELRTVELPAAGMTPCKLCSPLDAAVS
jgi:hypothetical protein